MNSILFINACVRPESRTKQLAEAVLECLGGSFQTLDLGHEAIMGLDAQALDRRNLLVAAGDYSDDMFRYARQFAQAQEIVIAAPYWDLSFPASLKAYIESINVSGLTFYYDQKGVPHSLCQAKRLIYVTTSGGIIGNCNFGYDYVAALCHGFYGIEDVRMFSAEGLDFDPNAAEAVLAEAMERVRRELI